MSDGRGTLTTRVCLNCGGVVCGEFPAGAIACGHSAPSLPASAGIPRTNCPARILGPLAHEAFRSRVAALLRRINGSYESAGYCDICESPIRVVGSDDIHASDCALAALLKEARA